MKTLNRKKNQKFETPVQALKKDNKKLKQHNKDLTNKVDSLNNSVEKNKRVTHDIQLKNK